jgi:hypothetical protein
MFEHVRRVLDGPDKLLHRGLTPLLRLVESITGRSSAEVGLLFLNASTALALSTAFLWGTVPSLRMGFVVLAMAAMVMRFTDGAKIRAVIAAEGSNALPRAFQSLVQLRKALGPFAFMLLAVAVSAPPLATEAQAYAPTIRATVWLLAAAITANLIALHAATSGRGRRRSVLARVAERLRVQQLAPVPVRG